MAAVGETVDSLIVWLPERRTALVSNLFGPLFPHFPNLNTLRGDRYRFVEPYLESVRKVRALRPDVLVTGRHEPIVGAELIDASPRAAGRRGGLRAPAGARGLQRGDRRVDADARDRAPAALAGRPGLRDGPLGGAHPVGELRGLVQAGDRPPSSIPTPPGRPSPTWWPPSVPRLPWSGPRPPWRGAT